MKRTYLIYFKRDENVDGQLCLETDDIDNLVDLLTVLRKYGIKWFSKDSREAFTSIDKILERNQNVSAQGAPGSG